jgi:hypothetical protein
MANPTGAQQPFRFLTSLHLTLLTDLRARDLAELVHHLASVPGSVIYYHTHHFLVQHQYLSPEPPNDFAWWISEVLQEGRLGEQVAAIDLMQFRTIRALRERLLAVMEPFLEGSLQLRVAPEGEEFHFRESVSFVVPTGIVARDLAQFLAGIEQVGFGSLAFHFFDARLHLERGHNDFSEWLDTTLGERELAQAIARIDPYTRTLEGLRREVARLVRTRLGGRPS